MRCDSKNLNRAKKAKEDEFYTQLADIERELKHYTRHFKNKVVYCNCDDPRVSNFFHFFSYNYEKLGLKKLIAGDGDFRSKEAIEVLKQADIVVTNPPFSLFREYVAQLMEYDKKFLILGNLNQVTSPGIARLITEGKMWQGNYSGNMAFRVPPYYEPRDTNYWVDEDGQKWRSIGTGCWYTNLDFAKQYEELILSKIYHPETYPTYVNYHAIEVARYKDTPVDYPGPMGVPVTALAKLSPDQFEIIGFSASLARPMAEVVKGATGSGRFYLDRGNGKYKRMYDRMVIKNKRM